MKERDERDAATSALEQRAQEAEKNWARAGSRAEAAEAREAALREALTEIEQIAPIVNWVDVVAHARAALEDASA